jgi:hypothetical protein
MPGRRFPITDNKCARRARTTEGCRKNAIQPNTIMVSLLASKVKPYFAVWPVSSLTASRSFRLWHDGRVLNETTSEQLRRESDELLKTAAKLIEHASTLRTRAAELRKQISLLERKIPKQIRKL